MAMQEFSHYSVLLSECIDALDIKPNGIYVDGTAGGGGHSYEIARHLGEGGRLIAIDQDEDAIAAATVTDVAVVNDSDLTLYITVDGVRATVSARSTYKFTEG